MTGTWFVFSMRHICQDVGREFSFTQTDNFFVMAAMNIIAAYGLNIENTADTQIKIG